MNPKVQESLVLYRSGSPLAMLYGTKNTMEQHHFNQAVMILNCGVNNHSYLPRASPANETTLNVNNISAGSKYFIGSGEWRVLAVAVCDEALHLGHGSLQLLPVRHSIHLWIMLVRSVRRGRCRGYLMHTIENEYRLSATENLHQKSRHI